MRAVARDPDHKWLKPPSACAVALFLCVLCGPVFQSSGLSNAKALSSQQNEQLQSGQEHAYAGRHAEGERDLSLYEPQPITLTPCIRVDSMHQVLRRGLDRRT